MKLEVKPLTEGEKVEGWVQMAEDSGAITGGEMQETERQPRKQKFAECQRADSNQTSQPEEQFYKLPKSDIYFNTDQSKLYTKFTLTLWTT